MKNKYSFFNSLLAFLIIGLFLPTFVSLAQQNLQVPETLPEAKGLGEGIGKKIIELLPGVLKELWEKEVLPTWRKMWEMAKNIWEKHIFPRFKIVWEKINAVFGKEIEKRKPTVEEEFKKEKEELKKEAPEIGKSFWERFKDLIK